MHEATQLFGFIFFFISTYHIFVISSLKANIHDSHEQCTVVDKSDVKKHATSPLHFQNIVGTATEQSVNLPEHPGNGTGIAFSF